MKSGRNVADECIVDFTFPVSAYLSRTFMPLRFDAFR
jgi:hypothetical protein